MKILIAAGWVLQIILCVLQYKVIGTCNSAAFVMPLFTFFYYFRSEIAEDFKLLLGEKEFLSLKSNENRAKSRDKHEYGKYLELKKGA